MFVRWFFVPAAILLAWCGSVLFWTLFYAPAIQWCPPEYMAWSECAEPWPTYVDNAIHSITFATGAVLGILAATLAAPTHKKRVARVVFSVFCALAVVSAFNAFDPSVWLYLGIALVPGVITIALVQKFASNV
jgi:hypothetical protein